MPVDVVCRLYIKDKKTCLHQVCIGKFMFVVVNVCCYMNLGLLHYNFNAFSSNAYNSNFALCKPSAYSSITICYCSIANSNTTCGINNNLCALFATTDVYCTVTASDKHRHCLYFKNIGFALIAAYSNPVKCCCNSLSKFGVFAIHIVHLSAKCLAERVTRKVLHF